MKWPVRFHSDESGAVIVEAAIGMTLLLMLTLGFVDFGYLFYQWNAAAKAVQVGARMASVSPPVAPEVKTAGPTATPGDPVPINNYSYVCVGATSCTPGTYTDTAANPNFSRIFRGDAAWSNDDACPALAAGQRPGMCHFFPWLQRDDVRITYAATGLGYQTRPGGAVPTITVEILPGHTFQFFFLGAFVNLGDLDFPPMLSTVTGEDLGNGG